MTRPKLATGLPVVRLVLARGGATWRWVTVAKRALQNGQRDSMSAHWSMQLGQKLWSQQSSCPTSKTSSSWHMPQVILMPASVTSSHLVTFSHLFTWSAQSRPTWETGDRKLEYWLQLARDTGTAVKLLAAACRPSTWTVDKYCVSSCPYTEAPQLDAAIPTIHQVCLSSLDKHRVCCKCYADMPRQIYASSVLGPNTVAAPHFGLQQFKRYAVSP